MSDLTDLLPIKGTDNPQRQADIIFIHGLGGDAKETWHPRGKKDNDDFWLMWLWEDLKDVGIWSLAYEVEPATWKGNSMPLVDRAASILAYLDINDIGERPVIFITHSMGGLLVKQMLRHAYDLGDPLWKKIVANTKGIVYLSTPHSGSNIASWLKYIGGFLGTSVSVKELEANDSRLRELNLLYRNHNVLSKIPLEVYFEKRKTSGVMVVNESSADPGISGVIPIPVDEDHISICRPESKKSLIYRRVKRFVSQVLANNEC